jgi:hypothetical protein
VANSSSSCFLIQNKTPEQLSFNEFLQDFPGVLGSLCKQTGKQEEQVLQETQTFILDPGENYVDSSDSGTDLVEKNLRGCMCLTKTSQRFEWKEIYNEQEY